MSDAAPHITPALLHQLAHLCRLRIEDAEVEKLTADMERILGYFDAVTNYPLPPGDWAESAVQPQSGAPADDILRDDVPQRDARARALVDLGPDADFGFYRVPRVINPTE
jgi:aspartyl/glutamyl-tRNA(Asn/Gln) amidotransferase C subunit